MSFLCPYLYQFLEVCTSVFFGECFEYRNCRLGVEIIVQGTVNFAVQYLLEFPWGCDQLSTRRIIPIILIVSLYSETPLRGRLCGNVRRNAHYPILNKSGGSMIDGQGWEHEWEV